MPWMVAPVGVPLMALKIWSESGRTLFMPSSTGLILNEGGGREEGGREMLMSSLDLFQTFYLNDDYKTYLVHAALPSNLVMSAQRENRERCYQRSHNQIIKQLIKTTNCFKLCLMSSL